MAEYRVKVNPNFLGELTLPFLDVPVTANQRIVLNEQQYRDGLIQGAIKRNYLIDDTPQEAVVEEVVEEVEAVHPTEDIEEVEIEEDIDPTLGEPETTPIVWDAEEQVAVDAKTGMKKMLKQLKGVEMDVAVGDIDFDKVEEEKKVAKKTRKRTVKKAAKKTKRVKKAKKAKKTAKKVKKGKTLPLPSSGDIEFIDSPANDGEISFVDEEQRIEKIKKHPVLNKKLENNEEVG